jgi:hypothetical protein
MDSLLKPVRKEVDLKKVTNGDEVNFTKNEFNGKVR